MRKIVKTLEEAKALKYGHSYSAHGYTEGKCAEEVADYSNPRCPSYHQCNNKNGYGPGGLYCKKHIPHDFLESVIKYRTRNWGSDIEKIEVVKETEKTVTIKGYGRVSRSGQYENIFDTWEDAHEYLLKRIDDKIESARIDILKYEKERAEIQALRQ
jgi:hypothetical protein